MQSKFDLNSEAAGLRVNIAKIKSMEVNTDNLSSFTGVGQRVDQAVLRR